jgi:hypothetical protein
MKTTEKNRLLKDVLSDESYTAFRAGLFDRLQVELRRQRVARQHRFALALAACVPIAFALYLVLSPRPSSSAHPPGVMVVHTSPMGADQLVRTAAINAPARLAQSRVLVVTTTSASVEMLHSSGQWLELVSDQQLLDLFKGQPIALVTVGPGERRLVLLNAETQTE